MTSESLPSLLCSKSPFPHPVTQSAACWGPQPILMLQLATWGGVRGAWGWDFVWGLQTIEGGAELRSGQEQCVSPALWEQL